jgi:hypothetical protein
MFFGLATLFVMVIVVVATAPAGVVVGLVGEGVDGLEPELELDPELLQAAIARAAAAANANRVMSMRPF